MKKRILLLVLLLTLLPGVEAQKKVDWNGYGQIRGSSNFDDNNTVMLRRLKFWIKSSPEFSQHWSYKVQVLFTSWMQERFFLQDAKINYKTGLFDFDMGQFVPKFSLQWTQPDAHIPSIERALVVNALHPNGTLGVRDLGIKANFHTANNFLQTGIGLFNGYGIKEYRFNNKGYLLTNKTSFTIPLSKNKLQFGYSLMYRYAQNLQIKHILPDTVFYTGTDFRYNFFAMFRSKVLWLQAEYINANLDNARADGYYFLSAINIKKSQIVLSFEDYNNTYSTSRSPYYRIGYNYLINNDKIKLFFDNYFQIISGKVDNYYASIELQMFFK